MKHLWLVGLNLAEEEMELIFKMNNLKLFNGSKTNIRWTTELLMQFKQSHPYLRRIYINHTEVEQGLDPSSLSTQSCVITHKKGAVQNE